MMRRSAAVLLALLAAFALPAAKPVPTGDAPARGADDRLERYRGQGISVCVADLRAVPDLSPDDLESICGCALDRFLQGRDTASLPEIGAGRFRGVMEGPLLSCTARTRPDRTSEVARRGVSLPDAPSTAVPPPPSLDAKPQAREGAPAEEGESGSGAGFWAWLDRLGVAGWLSAISLWWWIAIGTFGFGLLILAVRRRDPRRDLSAPPSHMRHITPAVAPRRPDLPR